MIQVAVIIIAVGVLLWLVNAYIPMEARVKQILNAAVIIVLVLWLLITLLQWAGISTGRL
jgi:hypothetical protein